MGVSMLPAWAEWHESDLPEYSVGVEEEVMLLSPTDWTLSHRAEEALEALASVVGSRMSAETHGSALELTTEPHTTVTAAIAQLRSLRNALVTGLAPLGLHAASAGMHPTAVWQDTRVSEGARYQFLYGTLRELARREPTFALHVHVAVREPETAVRVANRMRAHLPLLLALSANSPFWQGRDSGLASARTPLFSAFPRVGIPRGFARYGDWVGVVEGLLAAGAIPEPSFLWWDVRLQPGLGTVEVRVMDAQLYSGHSAALVALVQTLVALEAREGFADLELLAAPEALAENRFLAARDGPLARLIDPANDRRVEVAQLLEPVLEACRPHADDLRCRTELDLVSSLVAAGGAARQRAWATRPGGLSGVGSALSGAFLATGVSGRPHGGASAPAIHRVAV